MNEKEEEQVNTVPYAQSTIDDDSLSRKRKQDMTIADDHIEIIERGATIPLAKRSRETDAKVLHEVKAYPLTSQESHLHSLSVTSQKAMHRLFMEDISDDEEVSQAHHSHNTDRNLQAITTPPSSILNGPRDTQARSRELSASMRSNARRARSSTPVSPETNSAPITQYEKPRQVHSVKTIKNETRQHITARDWKSQRCDVSASSNSATSSTSPHFTTPLMHDPIQNSLHSWLKPGTKQSQISFGPPSKRTRDMNKTMLPEIERTPSLLTVLQRFDNGREILPDRTSDEEYSNAPSNPLMPKQHPLRSENSLLSTTNTASMSSDVTSTKRDLKSQPSDGMTISSKLPSSLRSHAPASHFPFSSSSLPVTKPTQINTPISTTFEIGSPPSSSISSGSDEASVVQLPAKASGPQRGVDMIQSNREPDAHHTGPFRLETTEFYTPSSKSKQLSEITNLHLLCFSMRKQKKTYPQIVKILDDEHQVKLSTTAVRSRHDSTKHSFVQAGVSMADVEEAINGNLSALVRINERLASFVANRTKPTSKRMDVSSDSACRERKEEDNNTAAYPTIDRAVRHRPPDSSCDSESPGDGRTPQTVSRPVVGGKTINLALFEHLLSAAQQNSDQENEMKKGSEVDISSDANKTKDLCYYVYHIERRVLPYVAHSNEEGENAEDMDWETIPWLQLQEEHYSLGSAQVAAAEIAIPNGKLESRFAVGSFGLKHVENKDELPTWTFAKEGVGRIEFRITKTLRTSQDFDKPIDKSTWMPRTFYSVIKRTVSEMTKHESGAPDTTLIVESPVEGGASFHAEVSNNKAIQTCAKLMLPTRCNSANLTVRKIELQNIEEELKRETHLVNGLFKYEEAGISVWVTTDELGGPRN